VKVKCEKRETKLKNASCSPPAGEPAGGLSTECGRGGRVIYTLNGKQRNLSQGKLGGLQYAYSGRCVVFFRRAPRRTPDEFTQTKKQTLHARHQVAGRQVAGRKDA